MGVSIQPQAGVTTVYREQTTPGVLATNDSSARVFRSTSTAGLRLVKSAVATAEVRSDLQKQRDRHGMRSVAGELPAELSLGTFDDLLQAVMRSTWSSPLTSGSFTLTSYVQSTGVITRATGSFVGEGFRVGDTIFANSAIGVNQNIPVVLTAVGTTTATVGNRTAWVDVSGPTGVTVTRSKKLTLGTTRRYFSVEHWAPTIADSQRFIDVRVSSVSFTFERGQPIGVSFGFTGRDMQTGTSQYFTSPTTSTSLQMTAADSLAILLGAQSLTLTSATLTLNLNHILPEVAGSVTGPDVIEGQATVEGSVTFYVTSQAQLAAYLAETQVVLSLLFRELGTNGFIGVSATNCTFGDYTTERIGQSDAQLVTVPLIVGIASGSDRDASMLTIQASNA
jgi:hypothetical protein